MAQDLTAKRKFLNVLIISLGVSALLGIMAVLFGTFGALKSKILLTTLVIGGFSLMSLCSAILYDKKMYMNFSIVGFVVYALSFLFTVFYIWGLFDYAQGAWKILSMLIVLSVAIAHASLLLLIQSKTPRIRQFLTMTLGFLALTAVILIAMILLDFKVAEFWFRLVGVFAILAILGTVITPIFQKTLSFRK